MPLKSALRLFGLDLRVTWSAAWPGHVRILTGRQETLVCGDSHAPHMSLKGCARAHSKCINGQGLGKASLPRLLVVAGPASIHHNSLQTDL